jgi:hypothetical protein
LVYIALNLFSGRQAGRNLPEKVKRYIKAFFRTIKDAQNQAQSLLFAAGSGMKCWLHASNPQLMVLAIWIGSIHSLFMQIS